jgi:hypothetical protein
MKGKKLLFSLFAVVVLLAVMATPVMAAETTEITGNVSEVLELTAPSGFSLGDMSPTSSPATGSSSTAGSVKCNDPDGYTVTVESNRADGKMQSTTPNTLTNALAVTTGSLSGATVTTTSQECVNTSAPGETSITLSVSQEIVYADAADTGYSITLTYTAAAKP